MFFKGCAIGTTFLILNCLFIMNILLTGANGYIGRRLLDLLVEQGHFVHCMVRDVNRIAISDSLKPHVKLHRANLSEPLKVEELPKDIDAAYYLVHSMTGSGSDFAERERKTAEHFMQYLEGTKAKHLIFLSGITNDEGLSKHLQSRKNVEGVLADSHIPLTVLRAGIVVGSGSASFEIIRDLIEKLPVMVAPKWVSTRCQPIGVRDVLQYLSGILLKPEAYHQTYDIGGADVLTYKQMMLQFAEERGYKRYIVTVPVLTPRLSSYWLYFVTSVSYSLARHLVDSMKNEVVAAPSAINSIVPIEPLTYRQAVRLAFDKIAQNAVVSSWKDSLAASNYQVNINDFVQVPEHGCLTDDRRISFSRNPNEVLANIWAIGGSRGWYYANWLWEIRGVLDKMVGGVGLRRGRRSDSQIIAGDALDFWRVILADKASKRLLLYAEMKLPGEAWLEFKIETNPDQAHTLLQRATFRPNGLLGRLYWYSLLPFHHFIFQNMALNIISYNAK